jgi:hypothetical protein
MSDSHLIILSPELILSGRGRPASRGGALYRLVSGVAPDLPGSAKP